MKLRHQILLLLAAVGLLLGTPHRAQAAANEYKVKAAFIYNFVQFIEWPASSFGADPKAPIIVATLGTDPFDGALEQSTAGREVNGRPIVVRHFPTGADVTACHVLYCGAAPLSEIRIAMERSGGSCLIVGESHELLDAGGVIQFYTEDNKLRFEINVKAAEHQKLKISAKLLKLARIHGD
jgi:hypothetical protein